MRAVALSQRGHFSFALTAYGHTTVADRDNAASMRRMRNLGRQSVFGREFAADEAKDILDDERPGKRRQSEQSRRRESDCCVQGMTAANCCRRASTEKETQRARESRSFAIQRVEYAQQNESRGEPPMSTGGRVGRAKARTSERLRHSCRDQECAVVESLESGLTVVDQREHLRRSACERRRSSDGVTPTLEALRRPVSRLADVEFLRGRQPSNSPTSPHDQYATCAYSSMRKELLRLERFSAARCLSALRLRCDS
jgi:hypothetical protein